MEDDQEEKPDDREDPATVISIDEGRHGGGKAVGGKKGRSRPSETGRRGTERLKKMQTKDLAQNDDDPREWVDGSRKRE